MSFAVMFALVFSNVGIAYKAYADDTISTEKSIVEEVQKVESEVETPAILENISDIDTSIETTTWDEDSVLISETKDETVLEEKVITPAEVIAPLIVEEEFVQVLDIIMDNANMCIEGDQTEMEITSDTSTQVNGNNAVLVATPYNASWTAFILGASWIWSTPQIVLVPNANEVETFTKTFNIAGAPSGATLMIAADNTYEVKVNNNLVCSDSNPYNFTLSTQDTCTIPASVLVTGENTITFKITNLQLFGENVAINPAGLMYKLFINSCVGINTAPVAVNDIYSMNENTTLAVGAPGVMVNDTDANGDTLTSMVVANPTHGNLVLNSNGSFVYTPNANFIGTDTFTYKVNDGALNSNIATVSITVNEVTDTCVEPSQTGWYTTYYNYPSTNIGMNLPVSQWYIKSTYGNPLSLDNPFVNTNDTWVANWYNTEFARFSQVESDLMFGSSFFPFDNPAPGIPEEITNGHDFYFGLHASAIVTAPTSGSYAFTLSGDDDVWVYVNGVLVVDDSGVHSASNVAGNISLNQGANTLEVYFAERHIVQSKLDFKFTNSTLAITPVGEPCVPTPANLPPTANAGTDTSITLPTNSLMLNGTGTDTDGTIVAYTWTQVSGPSIVDPSDVEDPIVNGLVQGVYVFQLIVTDDDGAMSAPDAVTITINHATSTPPECSDNMDNADTEDALIDANDPGCHTDGDVNNTESYDPNDNNETDVHDFCPNINGIQTEVPSGQHLDNGNCVDDSNGGSSGSRRSSSGSRPTGQVLGTSTDICNLAIETYMRVGHRNDPVQVKILQNFLNGYMNSGLIEDGIYGPMTANAVNNFQLKHADNVLKPWGLDGPTSIFYKTTLIQAKNLMCPQTLIPVPHVDNSDNWSQNPQLVPSRI